MFFLSVNYQAVKNNHFKNCFLVKVAVATYTVNVHSNTKSFIENLTLIQVLKYIIQDVK